MIVGLLAQKGGGADLMLSHQQPTGYGGFREEPSKAPGQCTPAQAAESSREERFRSLPATGGRGARLSGRVN
jgi:hypothetical protein